MESNILPWRLAAPSQPLPQKFGHFADSPFTWGGIGVLIGAAVTSPPLFRIVFIGAGVAVLVALLREKFLEGRSSTVQIVGTLLLIVGFASLWLVIWHKIPKPVEPLTKKDVLEVLQEQSSNVRTGSTNTPKATVDDGKPVTKADIIALVRQYNAQSQAQTNNATDEVRALTKAPRIAERLRTWWDLEGKKQDINKRSWEELNQHRQQHPGDQKGEREIEERKQAALREAEDQYSPEKLAALIADADWTRRELLEQIPTEQWIQLDRDEIQKFAEAIKNPNDSDKSQIASYLENLAKRLPPPK